MSTLQHRARAMSAYHAASTTVTPAMAIVMLYDGAMKFLSHARLAIEEGRIEDRCRLVNKSHAVIHGLQCQLDFDAGGDIAVTLDRYYSYVLHRMVQINIKNDPTICDELIDRLREMRESWATIAKSSSISAPSADQYREQLEVRG